MRGIVCTATVILAGIISCPRLGAQVSTDEAYQRLQEKQKQRDAERAQQVTVTRGQLDDMMAEIAKLKAENASLRQQLAQGGAGANAPPQGANPQPANPPIAAHKPPTKIDVGMTRDELVEFINARPDRYRLEGISVHNSGSPSGTRTVVTRETVTQDGSDAPMKANVRRTETIETHSPGHKRETIRVTLLEPREVPAGQHRDSLGHVVTETRTELRHAGWIWVTLVDDVVTATDVHAG